MANSSASYLDSPNTTETIYYTIYWASSLNGTNSRLYLNRVDHQNSAIRPSPISSITAMKFVSGSPYIPPTDGVISVYNGNVGIETTTPTKLHIETPADTSVTTQILNFKNAHGYGIYAESTSISGRQYIKF